MSMGNRSGPNGTPTSVYCRGHALLVRYGELTWSRMVTYVRSSSLNHRARLANTIRLFFLLG